MHFKSYSIIFSFPVQPWGCNQKLEWKYVWLVDPEPRRDVVLKFRCMLVARTAWHGGRCSLHPSSTTFPGTRQSGKTVRDCGFPLGEGAQSIFRISQFEFKSFKFYSVFMLRMTHPRPSPTEPCMLMIPSATSVHEL